MLNFKQLIVIAIVSLGLMACSTEGVKSLGDQYGQNLSMEKVTPVAEVFRNASDLNGQMVRVSGTVTDLCKHKGCWMQVSDGQNVLTVRFKDEAFILPASAQGRNVDMEGLFIVEKVSNPLGSHAACAEGGEHEGEGACEAERAEKTVHMTSDFRYTMVSTGLVLS